MDIVLLSEVIKEQDLWAYPYNALRNQAPRPRRHRREAPTPAS